MLSESFVLLAAVSGTAVVATFVALLWAAVQDGRDESAFRARQTDRLQPR
ncbi:MAG TPA: hypothetical protein VI300_21195 [Solirubrobacter sp.]